VTVTIRQLAEWVQKHPQATFRQIVAVKRLAEMDDMGDVATTSDPPDSNTEPDDGVKEAFKTAVMHIVEQALSGQMDAKEALKKIKKLIDSHCDVNGKGCDDDSDSTADDTDDDAESAKESVTRRARVITEALAACDKAQFRPSSQELNLVADVAADRRLALIARLKRVQEGTGQESPRSMSRVPGGSSVTQVTERTATIAALTDDPKKFREWVMQD
jgi:hypothetical protein